MPIMMTRRTASVRLQGAGGFSLLEVLVALLIISFGMLGIAGMQSLSISNTAVAGLHSIAASQAYAMANAMEVNKAFWAETNTNMGSSPVGDTSSIGTFTLVGSGPLFTMSCTSYTPCAVAQSDLQTFQAQLNTLPLGQATVTCTAAVVSGSINPQTCRIIISWVEKRLAQNQAVGTSGDTQTFSLLVQP